MRGGRVKSLQVCDLDRPSSLTECGREIGKQKGDDLLGFGGRCYYFAMQTNG